MSKLAASLKRLDESAESIQSLYFAPGGIFTNALTLKPYITRLIRDAQDHEAAMYTFDKSKEVARRVDGSGGVLAQLEDDEADMDYREKQEPIVRKIERTAEQQNKDESHLLNRVNLLRNGDLNSVLKMIEIVELSLTEDQTDRLENIRAKREKFELITEEVSKLELILEAQKRELKGLSVPNGPTQSELIRKEEAEIEELQQLLSRGKLN